MIHIQKYRNQEIYFNPKIDKFICTIYPQGIDKKGSSLLTLKKNIDVYIKDNVEFENFKILNVGKHSGDYSISDVVGIRKDGRLLVKSDKGTKQLRSYYEDDYVIYNSELDDTITKILKIEKEQSEYNNRCNLVIKQLRLGFDECKKLNIVIEGLKETYL